jgi:hypothetical protein
MFLSCLGQRRTKGHYLLLSVIIIKVSYFQKIRMKIRVISQTDGVGNE